MSSFLTGASHITRWMDDINNERLPSLSNVVLWGEGGLALFSERLRANIALHASKGKEIWLIVPDFRFGINFFKDHENFAETGHFVNGYSMIDRTMITEERDQILYHNALYILDYYVQLYGKNIKFIFWCLAVREQKNILFGKYLVNGIYKHPLWNYQELIKKYVSNSIDIWPMTQKFESYIIDQQGYPSLKGMSYLYNAFRLGDGNKAYEETEKNFDESIKKLFPAQNKPLNTSKEPTAFMGKDGFLFLENDSNRSMDQHYGRLTFTDKQKSTLKIMLNRRKEWMDKERTLFINMLIPDKQSLYYQYLPDPVSPSNTRAYCTYYNILKECEILTLDTLPFLNHELQNRNDLYDKVDTHWNGYGGFIGYKALVQFLKSLGLNVKILHEDEIELSSTVNAGDLGIKISPPVKGERIEGKVKNKQSKLLFSNELKLVQNRGMTKIFESDFTEGAKIVIFGDSFHYAMLPYLAESFSRLVFVYGSTIDYDLVTREAPDVVLCESIERFLINFPAEDIRSFSSEIYLEKLKAIGEEKAKECLDVLMIDENVTEALFYQGITQMAAGMFVEAIQSFKAVVQKDDKFDIVKHYLGLSFYELGIFDEAMKEMKASSYIFIDELQLPPIKSNFENAKKAVETFPNWDFASHHLAQLYMIRKDFVQAKIYASRACELSVKSPFAYYRLGQICISLEEYEEAEKTFLKSLEIYPIFSWAHRALGHLRFKSGNSIGAIESFTTLTNIIHNDAEAYLMIGASYIRLNNYQKSIENIMCAISLKPDYDSAYIQLSVAHRKNGNKIEAIKSLEKALSINPGNKSAMNELNGLLVNS